MQSADDQLVSDLRRLVEIESPSTDLPALHRCADEFMDIARAVTGLHVDRMTVEGRPTIYVGRSSAEILMLGHLDTVHPIGTIDRNPWSAGAEKITGPGVLDMKAGLIIGLQALAQSDNAALLVTSDEELGSGTSQPVILNQALNRKAVLVLEASQAGALKIARKGVGRFVLEFTGRAAHAGLEPERGANALLAMAMAAVEVAQLSATATGTTVIPTRASAGTASNVIPEHAFLTIDSRSVSAAEADRVADSLQHLTSAVDGVVIHLVRGATRPPFEAHQSRGLFDIARRAAYRVGLGELQGQAVGGGSDGNFTAAAGIPTLDGLGAVGGGAHTPDEWIQRRSLQQRIDLLVGLVNGITGCNR